MSRRIEPMGPSGSGSIHKGKPVLWPRIDNKRHHPDKDNDNFEEITTEEELEEQKHGVRKPAIYSNPHSSSNNEETPEDYYVSSSKDTQAQPNPSSAGVAQALKSKEGVHRAEFFGSLLSKVFKYASPKDERYKFCNVDSTIHVSFYQNKKPTLKKDLKDSVIIIGLDSKIIGKLWLELSVNNHRQIKMTIQTSEQKLYQVLKKEKKQAQTCFSKIKYELKKYKILFNAHIDLQLATKQREIIC